MPCARALPPIAGCLPACAISCRKHALTAPPLPPLKDAHVELKAVLKAIAASPDGGPLAAGETPPTGSKGDWLPNLSWLGKHPPDHPLRARLLVRERDHCRRCCWR